MQFAKPVENAAQQNAGKSRPRHQGPRCAKFRMLSVFASNPIHDMHKASEAVCAKLRLSAKSDKATALVATEIVELAKAGRKGDEIITRPCDLSKIMYPRPERLGGTGGDAGRDGDRWAFEPADPTSRRALPSSGPTRPRARKARRLSTSGIVDWRPERDMLWAPTIRAALVAGMPWLDVFCPVVGRAERSIGTLDRHPLASVGTLVLPLPPVVGARDGRAG
jgi:hypothetical protein